VLRKRKKEKKAPLNAVALNTIARLSNILPMGCVVHLICGGPSRKKSGSISVFLLFLLFIFDKMEKFKERGTVVKALKQNNWDMILLVSNTFIDDTVTFVHGHTEVFMEINRENCIPDRRIDGGFKYKAMLMKDSNSIYLPVIYLGL